MKKQYMIIVLILLMYPNPENGRESSKTDGIYHVYYVERYPFHYMENKKIAGIVADPVDYAFRKSGLPYRWEEMPPKRQMILLKENSTKVVMAGWFKNAEREKIAKFSTPVSQDRPSTFIWRKDNYRIQGITSFHTLLANRDIVLLVKEGYSYGIEIDRAIKRYHTRTISTTVDHPSMVRMIDAGRCDYMFSTQEEALQLIRSSGVDSSRISITTFPDFPSGEWRYLMFSKNISDDEIAIINSNIIRYRQVNR